MKKVILIFILIGNTWSFGSVKAQSIYNQYFDKVFSLEFEQAKKLLHSFEGNLLQEERLLLQAFTELQKNEGSKNPSVEKQAASLKLSEEALEILKEKKLNDRQIFYYTAALGIIIKHKMEHKQYFSVAKDLYHLSSKIKYVIDNENKTEYFRLISGIYHYYAELATEDYPIMRSVFLVLPEGDKVHGLKLLKTCSTESNRFVSVYALYYLARINHRDEKKFVHSNFYYRQLLAQFPENCFWRREYIKMLKYFGYEKSANEQEKNLELYLCK
jgi:hypothetical protein